MRNPQLLFICMLAITHKCRSINGNNKKPRTCVATQIQGANELGPQDNFMKSDAPDFLSVVSQPVFIDKTLLIEEIFQEPMRTNLFITYPRKWGKSINLDMINFFATMIIAEDGTIVNKTTTNAYNLFMNKKYKIPGPGNINYFELSEKLLISDKPTILAKHLGRYLTIPISLKLDVEHRGQLNYEKFLKSFQQMIDKQLMKHPYLKSKLKKLEENDDQFAIDCLNNIDLILDTKNILRNIGALQPTLRILCRCLHRCYKNTPILILIDEYDYVFNQIYFNSNYDHESADAKSIMSFINELMFRTFKDPLINDRGEAVSVTSVITGISGLPQSSIFTAMSSFSHWSMESSEKTGYPFYGLVTEEVKKLATLRHLPDHCLDSLISSFGGYKSNANLSDGIFNPISVIKFLNAHAGSSVNCQNAHLKNYWLNTSTSLSTSLPYVFTNFRVKSKIEPLLNLENVIAIKKYNLNPKVEQLNVIGKLIQCKNSEHVILCKRDADSAISVLLATGFLTISESQPYHTDEIYVKIPNAEIREFFKKELQTYNGSIYKFHVLLQGTAKAFEGFLKNGKMVDNFETSIRKLFKDNGTYMQFTNIVSKIGEKNVFLGKLGFLHKNEASVHLTIFQVLSLLRLDKKINLGSKVSFTFNSSVTTKKFEYRMDLVCNDKDSIMIIELKADKKVDIEDVFQQAQDNLLFFKSRPAGIEKFVSYKIVAINVEACDEVKIRTDVMTQEDVKKYIKTWDKLEENAKTMYDAVKGDSKFTWKNLPASEAKNFINKARMVHNLSTVPTVVHR